MGTPIKRIRAALGSWRRRTWFRHRLVRELAFVVRWLRERSDLPDLAHVADLTDSAEGPVQRDEAILLHGLLRVTRPRTAVEIGFLRGDSALNFLTALDPEARLYSFDIDPRCDAIVEAFFGHDARLVYHRRGQEEITAEDLDGKEVEFVFIDASHDLDLNRQLFQRLLPMLAANAIVAVHDTGSVHRSIVPDGHPILELPERWAGDEYEGQPGERAFINWLRETHPEFAQLHLHSHRVLRCGITLLQRSTALPRPEDGLTTGATPIIV